MGTTTKASAVVMGVVMGVGGGANGDIVGGALKPRRVFSRESLKRDLRERGCLERWLHEDRCAAFDNWLMLIRPRGILILHDSS